MARKVSTLSLPVASRSSSARMASSSSQCSGHCWIAFAKCLYWGGTCRRGCNGCNSNNNNNNNNNNSSNHNFNHDNNHNFNHNDNDYNTFDTFQAFSTTSKSSNSSIFLNGLRRTSH